MVDRPTVFISYSQKDLKWKERLVRHLGVLEKQKLLDVWDDSRIAAGDDWRSEIERAIHQASVAVLLITADFLSSDFVMGEEVPRILGRRVREGLRVVPVLVKPCDYEAVGWLAALKLPERGRALSAGSKHEREEELAAIARELREAVRSASLGRSERALPRSPGKFEARAVVSPAPSARSAPSATPPRRRRPSTDLRFLEGVWRGQQGWIYCVQIQNGELCCAYGFMSGEGIRGEVYDWQIVDGAIMARFRWLHKSLNGYMHLRVETPDRLVGGWWFANAVPDDLVKQLPNVGHMHPTVWERQANTQFPDWATAFFQSKADER